MIPNSTGTKCPSCQTSNFELAIDFPTGSNYQFYYIRCSGCKTFLQALPYFDVEEALKKHIKILDEKIDLLDLKVKKIASKLGA